MARSAALTQLPTSSRLIRVNGRTLSPQRAGPQEGRKRGRRTEGQGDGKGDSGASETKRDERGRDARNRTAIERRERDEEGAIAAKEERNYLLFVVWRDHTAVSTVYASHLHENA